MSVRPLEVHRDVGEGRPVVLIHGFPDTAASYDGIADALAAAGHRAIAVHLRGYTPSSIVDGRGYDALALAEDVVATLEHLGEDPAVLVGHDWGAAMAYGAASLVPERVRGVVGIAIPPIRSVTPTPAIAWGARHFLTLRLPGAAARFARDDMQGVRALYRRWAPNWRGPERDASIAAASAAFRDPRVLDAALAYYRALSPTQDPRTTRRLPMPGLVVGGDADVLPASAFARGRSGFTGPFTSLVISGAGHWPHREDEPRFTRALLDFLDSL